LGAILSLFYFVFDISDQSELLILIGHGSQFTSSKCSDEQSTTTDAANVCPHN